MYPRRTSISHAVVKSSSMTCISQHTSVEIPESKKIAPTVDRYRVNIVMQVQVQVLWPWWCSHGRCGRRGRSRSGDGAGRRRHADGHPIRSTKRLEASVQVTSVKSLTRGCTHPHYSVIMGDQNVLQI